MAAIQSDLIRLSFLHQREIAQGPYAKKCYFIMFGLKEELKGLLLPGFPEGLSDEVEYENKGGKFIWSIPISTYCNEDMLKSVFLHPERAGREEGFDLVDEICVCLLDDTTSPFFGHSNDSFTTGAKVWIVYMPDSDKK